MPAQRQTNTHSLTAHLVEVRDPDGTLYPSMSVDPGESVDWPAPIAGFDGWDWQAHYAAQAAAEGFEAPDAEATESTEAAPEAASPAKSRSKASVKAADTPEATA